MDDYKRSIYMEVRRRLENGSALYICTALKSIIDCYDTSVIQEVFPEFYRLFDNNRWHSDGSIVIGYVADEWWEMGWKEPRIRIIDCLLRE